MKRYGMKWFVVAMVLFGLEMCTPVSAQQPKEITSGSKGCVGLFDSRAVALAYYRSKEFITQMNELKTEYKKAKESGDMKRIEELAVKGPVQQDLMHKQVFSIWSVENILEKIQGKLPEIARQADVDAIVSKWNIAYKRAGVEFIDITDPLVRAFNPDKKTLEIIKDIQKQEPVPLEDLKSHEDEGK